MNSWKKLDWQNKGCDHCRISCECEDPDVIVFHLEGGWAGDAALNYSQKREEPWRWRMELAAPGEDLTGASERMIPVQFCPWCGLELPSIPETLLTTILSMVHHPDVDEVDLRTGLDFLMEIK